MRKKILKKIFAIGITAAIVACLPQVSVGASETMFNKKLLASLSKCTFQYDPSYAAKYANITDSGVKIWNGDYTTFTMNWSKRTQGGYTAAFITATLPRVHGLPPFADTIWCSDYSTNADPDVENWTHAVVRINKEVTVAVPAQAVMHEVGHVLGLKHRNDNPNSIMCQESFGRTATVPSDYDRALVALKYINNK